MRKEDIGDYIEATLGIIWLFLAFAFSKTVFDLLYIIGINWFVALVFATILWVTLGLTFKVTVMGMKWVWRLLFAKRLKPEIEGPDTASHPSPDRRESK